MQRIESVNARPNLNGSNKKGFHDNTDLSGQEATYLTPQWCNAVQEELANIVEGFGESLSTEKNDQILSVLSQLSNRITYLENQPKQEEIKIGDIFLTMNTFKNNDEVFAHKGYGEWESLGNGHALVTKGHDDSRPDWMRNLGNVGGGDTHQLTIDEMPSHTHEVNGVLDAYNQGKYKWRRTGVGGAFSQDGHPDQEGFWTSESTGGNQPHSNIQLSLIIGAWRRIG